MKQDVIALCSAMIEIDSINPFRTYRDDAGVLRIDGNDAEMLAFCEAYLQAGGFRTWRQDCGGGRENLLAEKGEASPHAILLYGHADTVEVKPGWSREEALQGRLGQREVDGRTQEVLYGLGSNDMKGGLAAILRAATTASFAGYRLKVVIGCDEEYWSLGSHCLIQDSDFLDDVIGALVPELGESTSLPEPGKVLVTLGRCGRTELVIDIPGTGGHGAEPDQPGRVNALTQAAQIALAVEAASRQMPAFVPFANLPEEIRPSALVTRIEGGEGHLSIPDRAQMIVNRVLVPTESPEGAEADLKALLHTMREDGRLRPVSQGGEVCWPTVATRPRPTPPLRPYVQAPATPFIQTVLALIGTQAPYQLGMGASVADENRFGAEAGIPVIVLGPRGERSHAAYEWVTTESLRQLEGLYRHIIEELQHCDMTALAAARKTTLPERIL